MQDVKVVIVDDNPDILRLMTFMIADRGENFISVKAERQSQDMLTEEFYADVDILILDLAMPGISGYSILPKVPAHVKVLIYSASANEQEVKRKLKKGSHYDSFIEKLYPRRLVSEVTRLADAIHEERARSSGQDG